EGCLVSVRGETTAEEVRTGRGRGKLIFRLASDPDHPLAKVKIDRWKRSQGVEVFYGRGIPSILGEHPSGELYRLEGELGAAPDWLIEGLTPKHSPRRATAKPSRNGPVTEIGTGDEEPDNAPASGVELGIEALDALRDRLGELAPELASP